MRKTGMLRGETGPQMLMFALGKKGVFSFFLFYFTFSAAACGRAKAAWSATTLSWVPSKPPYPVKVLELCVGEGGGGELAEAGTKNGSTGGRNGSGRGWCDRMCVQRGCADARGASELGADCICGRRGGRRFDAAQGERRLSGVQSWSGWRCVGGGGGGRQREGIYRRACVRACVRVVILMCRQREGTIDIAVQCSGEESVVRCGASSCHDGRTETKDGGAPSRRSVRAQTRSKTFRRRVPQGQPKRQLIIERQLGYGSAG
ncbi:hypothetical protein DFH27DRAFT_638188 [Peziza echinospora]|nr:hypothetical protein DFH27DRAFT_638188 [Peziza echinospora]